VGTPINVTSETTFAPFFLLGGAVRVWDYISVGATVFPVASAGATYNYRTNPQDPQSPREPDEIINDYDEQLTIANAVMNMIDTRSDVFCVWFVVHGYLPTDVEGLADDEPMVPSIARRYIMIVDRSNVVRLGEKPKILLFQEVPL